MRTSFFIFIFICLLSIACTSVKNSSGEMKSNAITSIQYTRDNGTVSPSSYRKSQYDIKSDQILFTLFDLEGNVLETRKINISSNQFVEIRNKLVAYEITKKCLFNSNEAIPPGGYSASVLMKTKGNELNKQYYIAAGNVHGCGDVISFEKFMLEFIKNK